MPALDVACHYNAVGADLESLPRASEALRLIADAGYRRVVLPPLDPAAVDTDALAALFATHGLTPITIAGQAPGALVASADREEREAGLAALFAQLDLVEAIGGDQMNGVPYGLFGPPSGPIPSDAFLRSADAVGRVADAAHERGITMTFEVLNRYETSMINTAAQAMAYVEASASDHLMIHLDTYHMAVEEADMLEAITLALPRLAFLELGQSGRGSLRTGAVDVGAVVQHALRSGYTRRFGVEAFTRQVLPSPAADGLAIWRTTYSDPAALIVEAMELITAAAR